MSAAKRWASREWSVPAAGLGAAALMTMAAYGLVVGPAIDAHQARIDNERRLADGIQLVRSAEASLRGIDERLASADEENDRLGLRPVGDLNALIAGFNESARSHGLQIDVIRPGTPVQSGSLVVVPITMGGVADSGRVVAFMRAMRAEHAAVAIRSFELRAERYDGRTNVRFRLELAWHASP